MPRAVPAWVDRQTRLGVTRGLVVVVAAGLALVVVLVLVVVLPVVQHATRSRLEQALATMPSEALRVSFTDWAAVRSAEPGSDLTAASPRREVRDFLHAAFRDDLIGGSAIDGSTRALATLYGFSPLDVEWESFGQSKLGAVDVVKLGPGADPDEIEGDLRSVGYQPPSGDGYVYRGGIDLVPQIAPSLTPVLQHVAVLGDQGLVAFSDNAEYLASAVEVLTGDRDAVLSSPRVADLAGALGDPTTAVLFAQDFVCADLAMSKAAPSDLALGERLVRRAGGVAPLEGYGVAMTASSHGPRALRIAFELTDGDQAVHDAESRARLAAGEAPGQGGSFDERVTLDSASADGSTALLTGTVPRRAYPMSDLTTGPVLVATC